jgi:peptidoglycan-N-acetylglucosamine deacetylase
MNKPISFVTTSWDDGDPYDLNVADLLGRYGIQGTFYLPLRGYRNRQTLDTKGLLSLRDRGYELGAHGVTHRPLNHISLDEVSYEVNHCKGLLEGQFGGNITAFCYPNGKFSRAAVKAVQEAGYELGRTTRMFSISTRFNPFLMPTSIQAYPHNPAAYLRNCLRSVDLHRIGKFVSRCHRLSNWSDWAKVLFDDVRKEGGVWHLFGHSWEIAETDIWSQVSDVLRYVSGHADVSYVTNTGVLRARLPKNETLGLWADRVN